MIRKHKLDIIRCFVRYLVDMVHGENQTSITDTDGLTRREATEAGFGIGQEIGLLDEEFGSKNHLPSGALFFRWEVRYCYLPNKSVGGFR